MKLYSGPLSLYARKVEIALREKAIAFERIMVPFTQETGYLPKNPEVMAANPKGQVPVLRHGDLTLYDSTVILEYLEDACPGPALMPKAPADRALCRQMELFADEVMIVPLRALMHRTGPRPRDSERWAELERGAAAARTVIATQYAELERALGGCGGFCGDLSTADIAVFMMPLFNQRLGGPSLAPTARLAAWYAAMARRPAFQAIGDEIRAADHRLSQPVEGAYPDRA
ncbi:glutathione S-transferase [Hoeflea sp. BAL378]|uniref:glutathione S-transferase family protein n=1 Tax=Hoeflea sp. BAL378 TaxID=1547437 RepID=UPI000512DA2E|nr:glutathione S-transferase family protein [Hoeflea sp. BAL378]KGF68208.1 glutathione S-transferase [Hoeflea sp. BAL378]